MTTTAASLRVTPARPAGRRCDHTYRRHAPAVLVREAAAGYDTDVSDDVTIHPTAPLAPHPDDAGDADDGGDDATDLRSAVRTAARAVGRVRDLALDEHGQGGELGALVELLATIDAAHVAAVSLADRAETRDLAPRRTGLPLEGLLAFRTRMTIGDRRTLLGAGAMLRQLPQLRSAFAAGALGWAQVRAIVAEARVLDGDGRARLDARFADQERLQRQDPDTVLDEVRDDVARLRPALARDRKLRRIEQRFLHIQPALDGALTGYFELDAEAGATVLAGLEAAMPPPSAGRRDVTADALGAATAQGDDGAPVEDGAAAPAPGVSRARQRADGLLRLAESFLAGGGGGGRSRPRLNVVTDVATLLGEDALAGRSKLLWAAAGRPPSLTPEAVRRLASDADLRHILVDGSKVLGVSEPTPVIPRAVREAVLTRDQGCRFPGCQVPSQWVDLHHVTARAAEGHTVVDNLVALCRRHHVAVTEGRWRLRMDTDGTVTVRRGQEVATSDPPLARREVVAVAGAPPTGRGPRARAAVRTGSDPPSHPEDLPF